MVETTKPHPITIDLNQFKLHIELRNRIELTLHFNSPSRKFYLSVIAFVVNEMKRQGKITSIPLEGHHDILALLNETIGGAAGSSEEENLLSRIYRKWQHALPNLEEAPLFMVLGRKKGYEEGIGKTYHFTETQKDIWANLFEYKGSHENVRLKFAIDKIGAGLDDVEIIYEGFSNADAWERFLSSLKEKEGEKQKVEPDTRVSEEPEVPVPQLEKRRIVLPSRYRWPALIAAIGVVVGAAAIAIWGLYIRDTPQPERTPPEKTTKEEVAPLQHEKPLAVVPPSIEAPDRRKMIVEGASKKKGESPSSEKVSKPVTPPPPKEEVASKEKMAFPLPDLPSIAVLPFTNMSDDLQQEYFSDGISDDIITDLAKLSGLIVIARSSSFTYKGKTIGVQQIGQDLKVRYLLEGSVRKAGDRVRINAQLVETSTGQHLWAERYEGRMDDIFALQDGITRNIVSALALKLTVSEQEALADKGTDNLLAYDQYLKGWENYRKQTDESFARAKFHLEKAIELDPEFSRAYAALAIMYWRAIETAGFKQGLGLNHWTKIMQASLKSRELLQKAMKKPTALAHGLMSQFYLNMFLHNEALAEIERAMAMVPNSPTLYSWRSKILWLMGKDREAIESAKRAMRLDPNNPIGYLITLAVAYLPDGDLHESLTLLERAKMLNPEYSTYVALLQSIIYGLQGRTEEARAAFEFFRKYKTDVSCPIFGLQRLVTGFPFMDLKKSDRIAEALGKAGAPGNSTDYCKVSRSNLLKGPEIINLLFGHKITGIDSLTGEQFWQEWDRNGESISVSSAIRDKGKWWIEGDVLYGRLEKLTGGLLFTETIFRNPDGTKEQMNQYFFVNHARIIYYFSRAD